MLVYFVLPTALLQIFLQRQQLSSIYCSTGNAIASRLSAPHQQTELMNFHLQKGMFRVSCHAFAERAYGAALMGFGGSPLMNHGNGRHRQHAAKNADSIRSSSSMISRRIRCIHASRHVLTRCRKRRNPECSEEESEEEGPQPKALDFQSNQNRSTTCARSFLCLR